MDHDHLARRRRPLDFVQKAEERVHLVRERRVPVHDWEASDTDASGRRLWHQTSNLEKLVFEVLHKRDEHVRPVVEPQPVEVGR